MSKKNGGPVIAPMEFTRAEIDRLASTVGTRDPGDLATIAKYLLLAPNSVTHPDRIREKIELLMRILQGDIAVQDNADELLVTVAQLKTDVIDAVIRVWMMEFYDEVVTLLHVYKDCDDRIQLILLDSIAEKLITSLHEHIDDVLHRLLN